MCHPGDVVFDGCLAMRCQVLGCTGVAEIVFHRCLKVKLRSAGSHCNHSRSRSFASQVLPSRRSIHARLKQ
jgi:hypothetical protein